MSLPGSSIESYAGYFTVNETYNSSLYFWFFPAENNRENAPVLLWLQGGPGLSSLYSLFEENGPFNVDNDMKLISREYSWHINHNLIYIDSPAGAGFSFTNSDDGYATNQNDVGRDLLSALQQFFQIFPELQNNEFFVAGESYAGKYIPAIGYAIHIDNQNKIVNSTKPKINLKGMAIGNGLSDPIHQLKHGEYLYQLGLIDSNELIFFQDLEQTIIDYINNKNFTAASDGFHDIIMLYHSVTELNNYNYLRDATYFGLPLATYLNILNIQGNIHAENMEFNVANRKVLTNLWPDRMKSVANWISELLSYYSILVYNGQLDVIVAYPLTRNYLENLHFSAADEYKIASRHIWRVDGEVAGYVKQAGNLTELLVRDAGHMVPYDQPKFAFDMITKFTRHESFF